MKSIKQKYICIIFIFLFCIFSNIASYGKYIFEKTIDIAQIDIDRQKPLLAVTKIEQEDNGIETKNVTIFLKVQERNLKSDGIDSKKIEIYIDNKKTDLEVQICKDEENINKEEYTFQIKVKKIPKDKKAEIKINKGTFTDTVGWESDEYIQEIEEKLL